MIKEITIDAKTVEEIKALGATEKDFERWGLRAMEDDHFVIVSKRKEKWIRGNRTDVKYIWVLKFTGGIYGDPEEDDAQ